MKRSEGTIWKAARMNKGLSQIEIARKLGFTSAQYVSNVETDKTTMSKKHFKKLSKVLGPDVVVSVIDVRTKKFKEKLLRF